MINTSGLLRMNWFSTYYFLSLRSFCLETSFTFNYWYVLFLPMSLFLCISVHSPVSFVIFLLCTSSCTSLIVYSIFFLLGASDINGICEEHTIVNHVKRMNLSIEIPSRNSQALSVNFIRINMPLTPSSAFKKPNGLPTRDSSVCCESCTGL